MVHTYPGVTTTNRFVLALRWDPATLLTQVSDGRCVAPHPAFSVSYLLTPLTCLAYARLLLTAHI